MSNNFTQEARRQVEICNACRYCEGYCSVFPAITEKRFFTDGDISQLANLCHNCRGCYYACQYTEPHEFALNLPAALAEVRHQSWKDHAWPKGFANAFDRSGLVITALLVLAVSLIFGLASAFRPEDGQGFYAYMSHALMLLIFVPAFILPLIAIGLSLRSYWRAVGGGRFNFTALLRAFASAGKMKNLSGGHGEGCNFEDEDTFSNKRRWFHHLTFYGFLMCFASTSSGTILHYGFGMHAPYGFFSLPKLFGVPGGIILCIGTAGLAWLKTKADPKLGSARFWSGEMAFVLLLFAVSLTGLMLYAATGTRGIQFLLPLHLGTVLAFFLLMPFSKMAHGFYRMAALIKNETNVKT